MLPFVYCSHGRKGQASNVFSTRLKLCFISYDDSVLFLFGFGVLRVLDEFNSKFQSFPGVFGSLCRHGPIFHGPSGQTLHALDGVVFLRVSSLGTEILFFAA